jgi:hypothetical protein
MYISSKMDTWQDKRMKAISRIVNKKNYLQNIILKNIMV